VTATDRLLLLTLVYVMQVTDIQWTEAEQQIAKLAFETAYDREVKSLIAQVHQRIDQINGVQDMWQLHDFLSIQRHTIDGKYDARDSALLFVFAQLLQEGWVTMPELDGLSADKIKKITALTRM
jgi:beta-N-acetylglucosaminidase